MLDWASIEQHINVATGTTFKLNKHSELAGGDINQAYRLDGLTDNSEASFFIKINQKNRLNMFEAEAAGLKEIESKQSIRVPRVICSGVESSRSYLILENLSLSSGRRGSAEQFGHQLAALHKNTSKKFGWVRENTIGSTPQINTGANKWIVFWKEQRLGYQLNLAKQNGVSNSLYEKGEKLLSNLGSLFVDYEPAASLLHGDLWSGNYSYLEDGAPVIYDPAVYYGDREADIAMTELFGGFPREFYDAYNEVWPLDKGYQQRKTLYNLYHVLNHYNLFGGGYAMQAENYINSLLDF